MGDANIGSPDSVLPVTRRGRLFVVAVLVLALALRLAVVAKIRSSYVPLNDAAHFDDIATSMANGHGYGNFPIPPAIGTGAFRSPLYPVALAAVYVVAGDHSWTAGLLQNALLGVLLVALVGLVATQLWSRRVGAIAMAIAAVHPTLILVGSSLQLEPLLVVLSLAALAAALQHRRSPRGLQWPIAAGVLMGLAILTREVGFALVPCIAWLLWPARTPEERARGRAVLAAPIAAVLIAGLVVVPWTIRNAARFSAFVPVSSSSGFGLAGTYNEVSLHNRGEWIRPYDDPHLLSVMAALDQPNEADVDKALRSAATDFAREHPGYIPQLAMWGTIRLFDLDGGAYDRHIAEFVPYPRWLTWLSILATYPLLIAAAFGAFTKRARQVPFAIWLMPLLVYASIALLLPANVRYRASIEPFTVFLASVALLPIIERLGLRLGWFAEAGAGDQEAGEPQTVGLPS
jgi:4-amino-4-deoxy-L-arabinose transferase-like glycosyltransferase